MSTIQLYAERDVALARVAALEVALKSVLENGSPWDDASPYLRSVCRYCGVGKAPHRPDCEWTAAWTLIESSALGVTPDALPAAEDETPPAHLPPAPPGFRYIKRINTNAAGNTDEGWYLYQEMPPGYYAAHWCGEGPGPAFKDVEGWAVFSKDGRRIEECRDEAHARRRAAELNTETPDVPGGTIYCASCGQYKDRCHGC